jgi:preprotein translocase subunit SecA
MSLLTLIIGSRNQRILKKYRNTVQSINALENCMAKLSDQELQAKTTEFKQRICNGATLDSLLTEAFAVCREAGKRVLGMRHFDVQLIGGMTLHYGKIAEMGTGEGKTLMATLPAYLNALSGKGVHVVTVNDYLAQRDAERMGRLYEWLGLSTGVNLSQMAHASKQEAYAADITYGTNNEFGFDYLRDNMVFDTSERVQRLLNFGIIDEVDSILIDEARTPLIISGQADDHTATYHLINDIPSQMTRQIGEDKHDGTGVVEIPGDYTLDEKSRQVLMTEMGHEKVENILTERGLLPAGASLYESAYITLVHHIYAALRAHCLYHKDQQYVVINDEVVIVDEQTGRMMTGRRWSDGLHQAVEAKEGVTVQNENQTLASITFQNYFRMYSRLSGMTGTADTEAYEFHEIYGLETIVIPQNRSLQRNDRQDQVYKTVDDKYSAMLLDILDCHERGQPVLVGTTSIDSSERLSDILHSAGLVHHVLNAKQHVREADVIAQAGSPGAITIATNMAGRGTDIVLGGSLDKKLQTIAESTDITQLEKEEDREYLHASWALLHKRVVDAGGLHIIGTERHESRRVDNQLRGRAGRQGDPGSSRFYLSLDDSLLRIFGGERLRSVMDRLKMPNGEPIEAGMVSKSIESAQRKVEARNFDTRKQLLEYDDVTNDQRKVMYRNRNEILESSDVSDRIAYLRRSVFTDILCQYVPEESVVEEWDAKGLEQKLASDWNIEFPIQDILAAEPDLSSSDLIERVLSAADQRYEMLVQVAGEDAFRSFERHVLLHSFDTQWRDHLSALDWLRDGIHLRSYAQKNPKQEYTRDAFSMFSQMLEMIKLNVVSQIMTVIYQQQPDISLDTSADVESGPYEPAVALPISDKIISVRTGRNSPCPCGSGSRYRQCHGTLT